MKYSFLNEWNLFVNNNVLTNGDEELDKQYLTQSNANIAVARKLLRKYPTPESMVNVLTKLSNECDNNVALRKRFIRLIKDFSVVTKEDYPKLVLDKFSDNHFYRRLFVGLALFATFTALFNYIFNIKKDDYINSNTVKSGVFGSMPSIMYWNKSKKDDAKNLYVKSEEDILKS